MNNPLLLPFNIPHETVPFHLIKIEHFEPAILEGMQAEDNEIAAIVTNPESPTFGNTILALENSGKLLERTLTIFFNLMSAETNDAMDALAEKMMPLISEHENNIRLNAELFQRIKAVYNNRLEFGLSDEESVLLDKVYDGFIRNGADLSEEKKTEFRKLSNDLSMLTLRFSQNNLKETNKFELYLEDEGQL